MQGTLYCHIVTLPLIAYRFAGKQVQKSAQKLHISAKKCTFFAFFCVFLVTF